MPEKVVLMLDGGFVKKKLQARSRKFPTPTEVIALCEVIMAKPRLKDKELFRVYYYDAPPLEGTAVNPIDGIKVNFSTTVQSSQNKAQFARKEGMKVYLECMGHPVKRELKAHADLVL